MEYQGANLYTISFSFVPQNLFGPWVGDAILISRMQGEVGKKTEIKQLAAEALGTSPQLILYSVLVGIADQCGISTIVGAKAADQVCDTPENHAGLLKAYDLFYRSLGAEPLECGVCRIDLSRPHKPVTEVNGTKRRRLRLRRDLRDGFSRASASSWIQLAMVNSRAIATEGDAVASEGFHLAG